MTRIPSFRLIATLILSLGMIVLGVINIQQKRRWVPPDDGVSWIEGTDGQVRADVVVAGGPGASAGILDGDVLVAIDETQIESDLHVTQILYELGEWTRATYHLERSGSEVSTALIVAPRREQFVYLELVGILYLLVGLLVVTKRWRAPHATHFYFVSLVSFVLYVFHNTGKFNSFDWTIYWSDLVASVLLPPMFLHFCLEFPSRSQWVQRFRSLLPLLYLPGLLLLLGEVGSVFGVLGTWPSPLILQNLLYTLSVTHLGLYLLAGAAVLLLTSRRVREPERVQQMKWVTRGTSLAAISFFLFLSLPRLLGFVGSGLEDMAVLPLILIPVSFGWAINQYRLTDVDILFKRGMAYTLTGLLVVGLYITVVVLIGQLFGEGFLALGVAAEIVATVVAALLFAPTKEHVQVWLDKFFYKDRYDLRVTVKDFGRDLGSEVDLAKVIDRIVERLSRSLSVDQMAVLLEDPTNGPRFVLARAHGLDIPEDSVFPFLTKDVAQPYVFAASNGDNPSGLNYFIPCRAKGRVIAFLGMGRTRDGKYLTSEDLALLEGLSDYIGIAVENAKLYRSLEDRAAEYQDLKDFSENIIESISVGVMVEVDGRIVGWNRALEKLTGARRSSVIGKETSMILPQGTLERLQDERNLYKHRWGSFVVNFSTTPLMDKEGLTSGRLIIVDDISERVRLEDQLVQNDKLTSVGLLAAGVAHEVNTPLAVISSYSQLLRKQLSPADDRTKLTEKIIRQTFRASEIVNNLLNFSRTNATEFAELDVHEVIAETLSLLEHQLKNSRVEVERGLSAEAPLVFANAGKMQQVFLNLFLNAKDAMPDGGTLSVRTDAVDSKLRIWIEDTGTGISSEIVRKIYDPFFTTKKVGKGTGLGLSVSYGIIQEHGGSIFVESEPGRGTTFRVELPLARKPVSVLD